MRLGILKGLVEKQDFTMEEFHRRVTQNMGGLGFNAKSGVNISRETALRFSAVYGCHRILAETLAVMPIILYKDRKVGDKSSGKDRAVDHPLYDILHNAPNSEMPAFTFKETLMGHILSGGNAYAQIQRSRRGNVVAMNLLLENQTTVERDPFTYEIVYKTNDRGKFVSLNPDEVFHIPGLGYDGIKGYSPIRMSMEAIGLGLAAESFGAYFFSNGANVSGIATYPNEISEEAYERYKREFKNNYAGLGKSNTILFLEEDMKFEKLTIPPNEAQFLETRKFQVEEIARIYRVPLHMLASLDRSTNNNIEQQSLEFIMYTMLPWLKRWEEYINFKLLTREERSQGYFVEFLVNALLKGDTKSRALMLQMMRQNGIINADQWLELENMNPQENGNGKTYFINGAMVPVEVAAKQEPRQTNANNNIR